MRKPRSNKSINELFTASPFSGEFLPTHKDIIQCYLNEMKFLSSNRKFDCHALNKVYSDVTTKLISVWKKTRIHTIQKKSICRKIKNYVTKFRSLRKLPKNRQSSKNYRQKINSFHKNSEALFDIALCKCSSGVTCKCFDVTVSNIIKDFLHDQRQTRTKTIRNIVRQLRCLSLPISAPITESTETYSQEKFENSQNVKSDTSFAVSLSLFM